MNISRKWIEIWTTRSVIHPTIRSGFPVAQEIAGIYGISYPTVRLRLDRLIAKIQLLGDPVPSEFERALRIEYSREKSSWTR
jgi:hypothetical protein